MYTSIMISQVVFLLSFVGVFMYQAIKQNKKVLPPPVEQQTVIKPPERDVRLDYIDKVKFEDVISDINKLLEIEFKRDLKRLEPNPYNIQFYNNLYDIPNLTELQELKLKITDKFMNILSEVMIFKLSMYIKKTDIHRWITLHIDTEVNKRYDIADQEQKKYAESVRKKAMIIDKEKKEKEENIKDAKNTEINKLWELFGIKPVLDTKERKVEEHDKEFMKSRYLLKKKELDAVSGIIMDKYDTLKANQQDGLRKEDFLDIVSYIENGDEIPLIITAEAMGWNKIKVNPNILEKAKMTVIDYLLPLGENPKVLFGSNISVPPSKYYDEYGTECNVYERVRPIFYKDYIYEKGYNNSIEVVKGEVGETFSIMERVG